MASITIRRLDDALKQQLKARARRHGWSMEEEAREILRVGVAEDDAPEMHLVDRILARFGPLGGVDLEIPPREPTREPPDFSE